MLVIGIAVLLTTIAWSQTFFWKVFPESYLAFWFPLVVIADQLTGTADVGTEILTSFIQFPIFAIGILVGIRRWRMVPVIALMLVFYLLIVFTAYVIWIRSLAISEHG